MATVEDVIEMLRRHLDDRSIVVIIDDLLELDLGERDLVTALRSIRAAIRMLDDG